MTSPANVPAPLVVGTGAEPLSGCVSPICASTARRSDTVRYRSSMGSIVAWFVPRPERHHRSARKTLNCAVTYVRSPATSAYFNLGQENRRSSCCFFSALAGCELYGLQQVADVMRKIIELQPEFTLRVGPERFVKFT